MLSKKTKYGIKALCYIAKKEKLSATPIQISIISNEENIPHKFLESILVTLKKGGFLSSKKGKGGGYYLLKPIEEIIMTDVYRCLEGPIAMVPCVSLNFYEKCDDCISEESCSIHQLMTEIRDSSLSILRNKTLADLI